jgi:UDP-2,3-diacylglucosamine hydrolase
MTLVFLSDQHLVSPTEEKSKELLLFFRSLRSADDCSHLFLVGDIFDLWISNHRTFIEKWREINTELLRLRLIGIEIHYFEGNHDLYLSDYFYSQLGLRVHSGPAVFNLEGTILRVEHGDQMDPTDRGYRFLRWFLRTPVMVWLAPRLPASWVEQIGQWASRESRDYTSGFQSFDADRSAAILEAHVRKLSAANNGPAINVFVCGHTHYALRKDIEVAPGQKILAINLGFRAAPVVLTLPVLEAPRRPQ